jgi:LuxR family transcriptional regulator, maltose regulon positive regulatory protein
MSQLGLLEAARGRLRAAARAANQTLELAERHGWSGSRQTSRAHLALTLVRAQWADLAGAQAHLEQSATSTRGAPSVLMDGSVIIEAWLRLARGDARGGLAVLASLRERLARSRPPAFLERLLTAMEAGLLAASGDAQAARSLLDRAQDSVEAAIALARMELAEGNPSGAAATLAPYLNGLTPTFSLALLLQAWLLDALAARALGDDDRAFRSLERALLLAEREGFRLAFLRAGGACRALLAEQLGRDTAHRQLIVDLLEMLEGAPGPSAGFPREEAALVEPLSGRERTVLRYLESVLSSSEIASELYVSVNTVRTHVKSIYRKLGVSGRREAIRRAHELRLL